eukprot:6275449-Amphidinium_carterae.1
MKILTTDWDSGTAVNRLVGPVAKVDAEGTVALQSAVTLPTMDDLRAPPAHPVEAVSLDQDILPLSAKPAAGTRWERTRDSLAARIRFFGTKALQLLLEVLKAITLWSVAGPIFTAMFTGMGKGLKAKTAIATFLAPFSYFIAI